MIVQPASLGPRSRPRRVLRIVGIVLPVVLLATVVGVGILGPAPAPPREPPSAGPAVAVADPSGGPSEAADAGPIGPVFPSTMGGLDVHGVHWMVEARNRGLARGVVAVAGYLGMDAIPGACRDARLGVFGPFCARVAVLGEAPWYGATQSGPDAPGFHLHPQFPVGVGMPSQAAFVAISASTQTPPVVLLGRFADDRAARCVPDGRHCGQEFVVERVAWVDGAAFPTTPTIDPLADIGGVSLAQVRADEAGALATLPAESYPLLAALVAPATIARVDPAIALSAGRLRQAAVWLVRGLHAPGDPTRIDWRVVSRDGGRVLASGSIQETRGPATFGG
ncbi:MAG TPA: hypothetical protein VFQ75_06265 [Candidatus Limnocylindrales bacterium]|nr:hypothetical protein [Candidatus Limnocylindrales bacterium]